MAEDTVRPRLSSEEGLESQLQKILDERDPEVTCCLGPDWDFATIEQDATRGPAHQFRGLPVETFARLLAHALHDLEHAVERSHPKLSASALADFWTSWQIERYIARFCRELGQAFPAKSDLIEEARYAVRTRLLGYVHGLRPKPVRSTTGFRSFPTPEGAGWGDVAIRFLSDHRVEISVAGRQESRSYAEMGFEDKRSRSQRKPTAAWEKLREFAEHDGTVRILRFGERMAAGPPPPVRPGVGSDTAARSTRRPGGPALGRGRALTEKRVQEIRRELKNLFGIESDPIPFHHRDQEYVAQFRISCGPSYQS